MRKVKVLAVASKGGHWSQLCRLNAAFQKYDTSYVTTVAKAVSPDGGKVTKLPDMSRSTPHRFPLLLVKLIWVFVTFRPDVVVTTGAAPGLVALWIAKVMGMKTIWIDSMANTEAVSLSGRLAKNCSDLWLTQWPEVLPTDSKLSYFGQVV